MRARTRGLLSDARGRLAIAGCYCATDAIDATWSGVTRQQPPTSRAPAAIHRRAASASTPVPGPPVHARRVASHPSPLFGYAITGSEVTAAIRSTCSGAVQFTPTARIPGVNATAATASSIGAPLRIRLPSAHENDTHAAASGV